MEASIASFVFVAARADGAKSYGIRRARSERGLAEGLRRERLVLLQSYRLPAWVSRGAARMPARDQLVLHEQLAQLLGRGVPLVEALEVAAGTVRPASRPRVEQMRDLVAAGSSFSDACQKDGGFDAITIAVYRAAERTGDLAGAGRQLATNVRRQLGIASKAVTLLTYPIIVLVLSLGITFLLMTQVVPRIGSSLRSMGIDLPVFTRAVLAAGEFSKHHWLALLASALAATVACVLLRRRLAIAAGAVLQRMPLTRDVLLAQESARFFSVMAAMARAGVPLADAIGVASGAVRHLALRRQLTHLRTRLVEGGLLRTLVEQVTALPLATRKLLIAAERSGDMESAFDTLANDLLDEVDRKSARFLAALEPALIILMVAVVGSIILAVMIPLLTVAGRVG